MGFQAFAVRHVCRTFRTLIYIDSLSRRFEPVCWALRGTTRPLRLTSLGNATLLLLLDLEQQGAVNVRQDTSKSDGGTDKRIEFLVTSDGEL